MSREAQIEPGWLVSLMSQWARHQLAITDKTLGYPRKAAGFSEKTTGGYNHSDPIALCARDYRELDNALEGLRIAEVELWATLMMYYKPWVVHSFVAEGHQFGTRTYRHRLHRAHRLLADMMDAAREVVFPDIKWLVVN